MRHPDFEELEQDFFRRGDALEEEGRQPVSFDDLDDPEPDDPRPAARSAVRAPARAADVSPAYASGAIQPARPGRRGVFALGGGFLLLSAIGIAIPNPSGESESVAASPTGARQTTLAVPVLPWMPAARPSAAPPPAAAAAEPLEVDVVKQPPAPRKVVKKVVKKTVKKSARKPAKTVKTVKTTAKRPAAKPRRVNARPVFPYWR